MKIVRSLIVSLGLLLCATARPAPAQTFEVSPQRYEAAKIAVEPYGAGQDVIFVPGLGCSPEVWYPIADKLRKTHTVHLVTIKGFGNSTRPSDQDSLAGVAESLAAYIQSRGLKSPAIIGHSFGGAAALLLAQSHPDAVGRVMVVDAMAFYSSLFGDTVTVDSAKPFADQAYDQLMTADPVTHQANQKISVARMAKSPADRDRILSWLVKSERETLARSIRNMMTTDLRPDMEKIKVPLTVLYAWDQQMPGLKERWVDRWEDQYEAAEQTKLVRIENSFHFIMYDQPERFAAEVEAFLK